MVMDGGWDTDRSIVHEQTTISQRQIDQVPDLGHSRPREIPQLSTYVWCAWDAIESSIDHRFACVCSHVLPRRRGGHSCIRHHAVEYVQDAAELGGGVEEQRTERHRDCDRRQQGGLGRQQGKMGRSVAGVWLLPVSDERCVGW